MASTATSKTATRYELFIFKCGDHHTIRYYDDPAEALAESDRLNALIPTLGCGDDFTAVYVDHDEDKGSAPAIDPKGAYTLDEIAQALQVTREAAYHRFIRPIDLETKERTTDAAGRPIPGVRHLSQGDMQIVLGSDLLDWMNQHEAIKN